MEHIIKAVQQYSTTIIDICNNANNQQPVIAQLLVQVGNERLNVQLYAMREFMCSNERVCVQVGDEKGQNKGSCT